MPEELVPEDDWDPDEELIALEVPLLDPEKEPLELLNPEWPA